MTFRGHKSSAGTALRLSKGPALLATRYSLPTTSRAFTLVELLIGASLSAAVLAAVLSSYIYLGRSLGRLANQQALETQARRALGTFTQDVQQATALVTQSTTPIFPAAHRLVLTMPTGTGTANTVTYYYNSDLTDSVVVAVNGINVTMPAASLTRCVYNPTSNTLTSTLILLRSLTDGDADEADNDLRFRYYDASGNEYETATLTAGSYLPGIKLVSLEFAARLGVAASNTQTPVQRESSSRVALRNRAFLQ
ncbi:PulJ/GspJ family protein [Lacunisphaera limnophila]|uniref:PulJ/GspJ family protein n=1 Tax=Lacunisphaera limnophila TaxID=1838286 RepID=UPI0012FDD2EA|nr:hypothetical protein [Lacunisphaera limnophila]